MKYQEEIKHQKTIATPCVIIGGGLAGLTMAASLGAQEIACTVIEKAPLSVLAEPVSDGRAFAIAYGSYRMLEACGVWQYLQEEHECGEIRDIRVSDGESSMFLHYDHTLVGDGPVGFMVENHRMKHALYKTISSMSSVSLYGDMQISTISHTSNKVVITFDHSKKVKEIEAQLVIVADGKYSFARQLLAIPTKGWDYNQTAMVCNVRHEFPHQSVAQERFLSPGPFAVLPLKDPYCSSIVWTEHNSAVSHFLKMSESRLDEELQERFGGYLGEVYHCSPLESYPLTLQIAASYIKGRSVLIGDAAHAIHPLAGQGFNLGIRDVEALTACIIQQIELGLDIASSVQLAQYEKLRQADVMALLAITDGLNRLFSNDNIPIAMARRIGLSLVNKMPSLKKRLMQHAMGV